MDIFIKATALVLISLIFYLILTKAGKDFAYVLSLGICCIVLVYALHYLKPVLSYFEKVQAIAGLDSTILAVIIKAVGIGIIAEIANTLCTDAGNASMGKTIQLLAIAVILTLSAPLFETMLTMIEDLLEIQ